jgi:hypothetical protein
MKACRSESVEASFQMLKPDHMTGTSPVKTSSMKARGSFSS